MSSGKSVEQEASVAEAARRMPAFFRELDAVCACVRGLPATVTEARRFLLACFGKALAQCAVDACLDGRQRLQALEGRRRRLSAAAEGLPGRGEDMVDVPEAVLAHEFAAVYAADPSFAVAKAREAARRSWSCAAVCWLLAKAIDEHGAETEEGLSACLDALAGYLGVRVPGTA